MATSSLVGEVLLPLMRPPGYETRPTTNWLADHGPHFNGTGDRARQAAEALMLLTGRQALHALTLLPWAKRLAPSELIRLRRPARVWCTACYTDRVHRGEPLYEPLLWSIAVVTVCPPHKIPLQTLAPTPIVRERSQRLQHGPVLGTARGVDAHSMDQARNDRTVPASWKGAGTSGWHSSLVPCWRRAATHSAQMRRPVGWA